MTEGGAEGQTFYTDWNETADSFDQMNLHENLLRGIYAVRSFGERTRRGEIAQPSPAAARGGSGPSGVAAERAPRGGSLSTLSSCWRGRGRSE